MDDNLVKLAEISKENQEQSLQVLTKLVEAAKPAAVYSKPIKIGDTQVITASEITVGVGFGHGFGSGLQMVGNLEVEDPVDGEPGVGTGSGGGGGASGRPVAVITIKGEEVKVEPIFDTTKIALAFFTMLGSVFFMGAQMKKRK